MNNIERFSYCYGCGVCRRACPHDAIDMNQNKNGFYQPIVNYDKCVDCGICLDVCAFNDSEVLSCKDQSDNEFFGAWANDREIRYKSSSGGVGYLIGKHLIRRGYKVCCVRYNSEKQRAEHFMAEDIESLGQSAGSKYIQSETSTGFDLINRKEKYLVVGTPCQIDSIRRFIRKFKVEENFVLVDFFCHGVPSPKVWQKYLQSLPQAEQDKTFSWRDKQNGWQDSWAISAEGYFSAASQGDSFFKMFFDHTCLGKACYLDCKYKLTNSAADIRLGDLWGDKYKDQNDGVSAVIAFTAKGKALIKSLEDCTIVKEDSIGVLNGQMAKSPALPLFYPLMMRCVRSNLSIERTAKLCNMLQLPFRIKRRIKRLIRKK